MRTYSEDEVMQMIGSYANLVGNFTQYRECSRGSLREWRLAEEIQELFLPACLEMIPEEIKSRLELLKDNGIALEEECRKAIKCFKQGDSYD